MIHLSSESKQLRNKFDTTGLELTCVVPLEYAVNNGPDSQYAGLRQWSSNL